MRIDRLGEAGLIRLIQRAVRSRGRVKVGIGDDACVLRDGTVITTDAYAEGVHFSLSYMSWRQVGRRCACAAVSDIVAMAGQPEVVLISLAIPPSTDSQRVKQLYAGVEDVCAEMGCEVAGGDIIAMDRLVLALAVTGKAEHPKLRSGARSGDRVYVTGSVGAAEAGRMVLAEQVRMQKSECRSQNAGRREAAPTWAKRLVERHVRPVPRLQVARALAPGIHGLIDTSDGLATDARHLCEMSRVRIVLDAERIPVSPATARLCTEQGLDPIRFALTSGEDYELLFTSRSPLPERVKGVDVACIGTVQTGSGLLLSCCGHLEPVRLSGYDHLSGGVRSGALPVDKYVDKSADW
jgi:thiamine-monophosphate kinase